MQQANGSVKTRMRVWKEDIRSKAWEIALPDIMLKMNRAIHGATGQSPYEVIFGRKSSWNEHHSRGEPTTVSIDHISDEVTSERSTVSAKLEDVDLNNFTEHYAFNLD